MNQPDFRRPRDPLTGREGYSTVYEARKRQQGLIPGKPVAPLAATTRSDFELGSISELG